MSNVKIFTPEATSNVFSTTLLPVISYMAIVNLEVLDTSIDMFTTSLAELGKANNCELLSVVLSLFEVAIWF